MKPIVSVIVPSLNQGRFLDAALRSIFQQNVPLEVFVQDGGSTDNSMAVIQTWRTHLAGARSHRDAGQSAAINEGVAQATAPYVCWLNSDDIMLDGGLVNLVAALERQPEAPAAYGRVWNLDEATGRRRPVWVQPFARRALALRCIVSQPGTLVRRSAWDAVGGLDETLHMAMDYDLWWKLYQSFGDFIFVDGFVAVNRNHGATKTNKFRSAHYREAMNVVRRHNGSLPLKWRMYQPYAVWWKALTNGA
ncbi:glycosyltransferase family 2 protein [Mesorhizobium sp. BR1-1-2]|uniref:glycosyltransferase family 2 protein n=1 Tax=Mesorhizobium sp. BR1-1-2 TaxID=2876652 RepID=UPI001CC900C6|nr:glycosyltransferase family 2 protein [Mesorhizobium sp. BR1-1-2]MBZ9965025.1 glycosyltransferase [Mesorhizobium sp. BR1-1-2]